jgi:hypothetical protein
MQTLYPTIHNCSSCNKQFNVIKQEADFYQKKELPLPIFCPACRHKQRMALRSERALYKRTCYYCKNECLSTIPETATYKIACPNCFWENCN